MERVYSAFFTADRPKKKPQQQQQEEEKKKETPLTAEALEKHNETQEKLSQDALDARQIDAVLVHYDDGDGGEEGGDEGGEDARRKKKGGKSGSGSNDE